MKIGDAIGDVGLRMAALNALRSAGVVNDAVLKAALAPAIERIRANDKYWHGEDGERRVDAGEWMEDLLGHAITALASVEVQASDLAAITSLSFDGGEEIYMWLEENTAEQLDLDAWELDTGGESNLYRVESFDGVQALPALTSLLLDAYGWSDSPRDATPLVALKELSTLKLMGSPLENAQILAQLPSLRKVTGADDLDPTVCTALRNAGVEVS
jgi:hypothetical protein